MAALTAPAPLNESQRVRGLLVVGISAFNTTMFLVAAGVFTIGAIVCRPEQETMTANLADPTARGTSFGVSFLYAEPGLTLVVPGRGCETRNLRTFAGGEAIASLPRTRSE
ncbi:MAG TPA: hypothetical protein VD767_05775 [Thermomicrobiales bacterium]|nr:hypothetical protein [Thermomicrobiales bacterium]